MVGRGRLLDLGAWAGGVGGRIVREGGGCNITR